MIIEDVHARAPKSTKLHTAKVNVISSTVYDIKFHVSIQHWIQGGFGVYNLIPNMHIDEN